MGLAVLSMSDPGPELEDLKPGQDAVNIYMLDPNEAQMHRNRNPEMKNA